ncbi:ATP-binding protein [Streptomyces sp. NPDC048172]|uniref:ATP-binding protein n=1 Tax=Streptomyces sp. NPDC048172 TaxID=3365505 RepID=UPI00371CC45F
MSGSADNVVLARDISGEVHFHHAVSATRPVIPAPRQLPHDVRHFVNRHAEFEGLAATLSAAGVHAPRIPVVLVTGAPGVGKTSLALRWAHRIADRFPDGQLYADLRGHDHDAPRTPLEVLRGFLGALGTPHRAVPEELEAAAALFRSCLADRRVLVLLDNAASTAQVRPLLPGGPAALTIVTSRSRLSGLSVREGAHRMVLDLLSETEAVTLLRTVVEGHRAGDDTEALAELARLCARLPLALRIAGERVVSHPHLRLDDLNAQLRDRASRWHALSTDEDEGDRPYDVRTVFDWSYDALPPSVARLFRLLGGHPGIAFGSHDAAALAALGTAETRRLLDKLTGAHLLEQTGSDRFQFHDLLRAYAADQSHALDSPPAREAALRRLLTWYFHTATGALALLEPTATEPVTLSAGSGVEPLPLRDREHALAWFRQEHAALQAAVHAAARSGSDELASKLPLVLWRSDALPLTSTELLGMAEISLAASRRLGDRAAEARTLGRMGRVLSSRRRFEESRGCQQRALALFRGLGDRSGEAASLGAIGLDHFRAKEHDAAVPRLTEACALFGDIGEHRRAASAMVDLAHCRVETGEVTAAVTLVERALETQRAVGDTQGEGRALRVLSNIHLANGDARAALLAAERSVECAVRLGYPRSEAARLLTLAAAQEDLSLHEAALVSYERAAEVFRGVDDRFYEAMAWFYSAGTLQCLGRAPEAESLLRQAAAVFYEHGDSWQEAMALDLLGDLVRERDPEQALRLWGTALRQVAGRHGDRGERASARIGAKLAEGAPEAGDG